MRLQNLRMLLPFVCSCRIFVNQLLQSQSLFVEASFASRRLDCSCRMKRFCLKCQASSLLMNFLRFRNAHLP